MTVCPYLPNGADSSSITENSVFLKQAMQSRISPFCV